jgi:predicted P-loop ATPase
MTLPCARTFASAAEAADWYISQGFWVIPVPYRKKKPNGNAWQKLRISVADVPAYFNGKPQNVGALWGDASGSVDVDLDASEAIALAPALLPYTGMIFGHASKPRSHHIFRIIPVSQRLQFRDPLNTKSMLVELRGLTKKNTVGFQSVMPCSIHEKTGEVITFEPGHDSTPTSVVAADLIRAVHKVAAGALLCRYWPAHCRHDTMLALAGTLARAQWPREEARMFCRAIYEAVPTHDPNALARVDSEVNDSFDKVVAGEPATGIPSLAEHIDQKVVRAAFAWLGLKPSGAVHSVALTSDEDWRAELIVGRGRQPKALLANAVVMLRHHPEMRGVLAFNEFSLHATTMRPAPWPQSIADAIWTDDDDSRVACWLQQQGVAVSSKVAAEAVQVIAHESPFHPIKKYLGGLAWDQQPRIEHWLHDDLGAEDSALNAAMGAKWLISGVARIAHPGCQADHVLLLEGEQGLGKSSALRVLAGDEYFTDHLSDLGSKDSRLELHGRWIIEMSEFTSRRSELERKAFLTATADNFRPPYERRTKWVPRSCIFAGTTNDATPLTDETGGRRYWIVTCGNVDIEKLNADRDQLWAEAYARYLAGEPWHDHFPEFREALAVEQEDRYQGGPFDEAILTWLENPEPRQFDSHADRTSLTFDSAVGRVTINDVLIHAVGKAQHAISRNDQLTARACLVHAGWRREKLSRIPGTKNRVARFYVKEASCR